jgi:hypothetical protein
MVLLLEYIYIELYTIERLKPILTIEFLPWEGGARGGRQHPERHIKKEQKLRT